MVKEGRQGDGWMVDGRSGSGMGEEAEGCGRLEEVHRRSGGVAGVQRGRNEDRQEEPSEDGVRVAGGRTGKGGAPR